MKKEPLWTIELKRIDKNQRVSWRALRQPITGKPLMWTSKETAEHYAICYCGFQEGRSRVSPFD